MKVDKKYIRIFVCIIISVLLTEVFVFNFRFWESLFFEKISDYSVTYKGDTIELTGIGSKVKNIYFKKSDHAEEYPLKLSITISDEANTGLVLSETEVINAVKESNYIRIYPDGKVSEIKIKIISEEKGGSSKTVDHDKVILELNARRPFNFRIGRFGLLLLLVCIIALFSPGSPVYKIKLFDKGNCSVSTGKRIFIYAFLMLCLILWFYIPIRLQGAPQFVYYNWNYVEAIYTFQAEAFLNGQVHLKQTPPAYLSQMENPYDHAKRLELMKETGESFNLDFAFYNGKYYCYYGVVPVLLFYLPFLKIFGFPANNSFAVVFFGGIFISACFRLIRCLCRRRNKDISLGMYTLLCAALLFGSGVFYCAQVPTIYSVPFISAFAFVVSGLVCWFRATENNKDESHSLFKRWLIAGSLCMGLAIGCRPVFGLFVFFAFPVFADEIRQKKFFSKKGTCNTLCVILPVFLIGCGLLFYNYIRFGNPIDFGHKYNLSATDLAHRFPEARRVFFGLFEYLFQPFNVKATFPYFSPVYSPHITEIDYLGYQFFDPVYCGFLILSPLSLFILGIRRRKALLKANSFYHYSVLSLVFAIIMLIVNSEFTGITTRYQLDFSLFLIIPSLMVILDIENELKEKNKKFHGYFVRLIAAGTAYTICISLFLLMGTDTFSPMNKLAPPLFYSLKYLLFVPR